MFIRAGRPSVRIAGTTAARRPELAGVTEVPDELRTFRIPFGPSGAECVGEIQEAVTRGADSSLTFYYRITQLAGADLLDVSVPASYVTNPTIVHPEEIDVDFRIDGLGDVGPSAASYNVRDVQFIFEPPITPTQTSLFFFVKTTTQDFANDGEIRVSVLSRKFGPSPSWVLLTNCRRGILS